MKDATSNTEKEITENTSDEDDLIVASFTNPRNLRYCYSCSWKLTLNLKQQNDEWHALRKEQDESFKLTKKRFKLTNSLHTLSIHHFRTCKTLL